MDYSTWALLLLFVGILLLVAEVFIPSGGAISVMATVCLVAALVCAWYAWWPKSQGYFWIFIASMAALLPSVISAAFYVWPNTPIGKRAILEAPTPEEVESFVELQEKYGRMVGKIGETATLLNPAGIIRIDGERVHCQSEGMIIEPGLPVRIIAVQGNRVLVRRTVLEPQAAGDDSPLPSHPQTTPPLDFDIS